MATRAVHIQLTLRGWVLGILSILLGMEGIYRKELASLLWGIGMGSLWVCTLIFSGFASTLLYRKKDHLLQHLSLTHPTDTVFAGTPLTFQLLLPAPLLRGFRHIPCVVLKYRYQVTAFKGRTYRWEAWIDPKEPSFTLTSPPAERGDYRGPVGYLQVEDCFGFSKIEMSLTEKERLLILPAPYPEVILQMLPARGGTRVREHRFPSISLEELEIRKYQPGDDIRRIHWKLYAHSGELFFRTGEHDPPPLDTIHLHFDPSLPQELPPRFHLPAMDLMASLGARVLMELSKEGKRILLSTNPPITSERPRDFWFTLPVLELEVGYPEPGLAVLARLAPEPSLQPLLATLRMSPQRAERRGSSLPVASAAGYPMRVLFLFVDSPGTEALPMSKVNTGEKPWSFFTLERSNSPLETTPIQVILIDPSKGLEHAKPL